MSENWKYGEPFELKGMSDSKVLARACEPRKIQFEEHKYPVAGWYVVVFPKIHDESRNVEMWLSNALKWLRCSGIQEYTWGLRHGLKKDEGITSPVMYFKDRFDALRMVWRFSGDLQEN